MYKVGVMGCVNHHSWCGEFPLLLQIEASQMEQEQAP